MNCFEQNFFHKAFPAYFSETIQEFLSNDDPTTIYNISLLSSRLFLLFEKHIKEPNFYKVITKILEENFNILIENHQKNKLSSKQQKQLIFLQFYLQKLWTKFSENYGKTINEEELKKILWEIRLEFQFDSSIGGYQKFIVNLLNSLNLEKCPESFKTTLKVILDNNEFDTSKFNKYFNSGSIFNERSLNQSRNIFDKVLEEKKNRQILKQNLSNKLKCQENDRLVESLKKRNENKRIQNSANTNRTMFFTHPKKFKVKNQDRIHSIYEYVEQDSYN